MQNSPQKNIGYKTILQLAIPGMFSGMFVTIAGIIDTALIGHFGTTAMLGAIALSTALLSFLFGMFAFLRAVITGLTSQAAGAKQWQTLWTNLVNATFIAIICGIIITPLSPIIFKIANNFLNPAAEIIPHFYDYFTIRMYGVFFIFIQFTTIGFLIGLQQIRLVLLTYMCIAIINIILSFILIVGFGLGAIGSAIGTLVADIFGGFVVLFFIYRTFKKLPVDTSKLTISINLKKIKTILFYGSNHTLRSMLLTLAFLFFIDMSETLGINQFAANIILWNIFFVIIFIIDGYAYSSEALCGNAYGASDPVMLKRIILLTAKLAYLTAILLSAIMYFGIDYIAVLMTNKQVVLENIDKSVLWFALLPIISVGCFLLDGIYIGLLAMNIMRNFMILSILVYIPIGYLMTHYFANDGLWLGIMIFFILRSLAVVKLPHIIKTIQKGEANG